MLRSAAGQRAVGAQAVNAASRILQAGLAAAAGQGGFKLSLRGYDNEGDYLTITRSAKGRRVCLEEPARSLFLLKPTKSVAHKGGERFKTDSPEFQILADWIASGASALKCRR